MTVTGLISCSFALYCCTHLGVLANLRSLRLLFKNLELFNRNCWWFFTLLRVQPLPISGILGIRASDKRAVG